MSRFLRFALLLIAAAALAGCAHAIKVPLLGSLNTSTPPPSRDTALQRLKNATPCCHTWADLPFHDALPNKPREFTIDRFTPVAILDDAPTHFLTFILPKYKKPYRVVFQTQPSARGLDKSFLLAPTATVLNSNYQPLSSTNVPLCVYIGWRPGMSGAFGAVKIDSPNAQYLVISTSQKQLAATTYWAQSPTTFSDVNVPSSTGLVSAHADAPTTSGTFNLPHAPEGSLYIGKMTSAYASAVDNGLCGKPSVGAGLLPSLRHRLLQHL
ncbi:MAG TPA: hypothetical protein VF292_01975 [Rhodanobacteraceae bacterium]